jgi:hypothetical protein
MSDPDADLPEQNEPLGETDEDFLVPAADPELTEMDDEFENSDVPAEPGGDDEAQSDGVGP